MAITLTEESNLDPWQIEVLKTTGNILVRSGRQVGKSHIIALKVAKWALKNPNKFVLIISKTEKQGFWIFAKTLYFLHKLSANSIKKGKDRPTKHIVNLSNGTSINCHAAGETGFGLMGATVNLFVADEASFINEMVFKMLNPAMAVAKAEQWLLSTPYLEEGYFYDCEKNDESFTVFHTTSEDCPRKDQKFLDREKARLTVAEYAQLYLGQYRSEFKHLYSDELIKAVCTGKRREEVYPNGVHYLGCDVARMDRDEFTYEIVDKRPKGKLVHVENIVTTNVPIPESVRRIISLNAKYHFKAEYIDSGGMGITVCDLLREDPANKRKVVEINNASRPYNLEEGRKKILKEDLYMNLLRLMEKGEIVLLDDDNLKSSLRCIQAEHNAQTGRLHISGSESHIVEGLIRAVHCTKDHRLKLWVR